MTQLMQHLQRNSIFRLTALASAMALTTCSVWAGDVVPQPKPPGKLVDLGGHRLHVNCTGKGAPTVVIENGLGDFSFDWVLVQNPVSRFTRVCTYDRAGYAWSEPGPKPRTFAQLNLELRDALSKLGERVPFVLVGHSYGGPVVRNFAASYPNDVAGMILVDSAFEGERVGVGGGKTIRLGDGAKGLVIPAPREQLKASDKPNLAATGSPAQQPLDAMYKALPPAAQKLQVWAQSPVQVSTLEDAESSQLEWSGEYFAKWLSKSQAGALGSVPLIVLTRADGGYGNDLDVPAAQIEKERVDGQAKLVLLSSNSKQTIVHSGHNMELEAPGDVTAAIREVVEAVRYHRRLQRANTTVL
jgi:pimeloyl-ACP methyl ester carboxylesterase